MLESFGWCDTCYNTDMSISMGSALMLCAIIDVTCLFARCDCITYARSGGYVRSQQ